ncbi:MAG: hypothetical protein HYW26_01590 [Candidatus Aenigmarchaeota archaeon]|nr:hypothetical protein [Candidatus Aenigmarchaeota archaeon]
MHINEFARIAHERDRKHDKNKAFNWEFYSIAMGGEAGEVLNNVKKLKRGDPISKEEFFKDLAEEAADVITFGFLLLSELGADPEKILLEKYEKVNRRLDDGGFHKRPE